MLGFYQTHGPVAEPGRYAQALAQLPVTVPELVAALQQLVVHVFWAKHYGLDLAPERQDEVNLRWVPRQVERVLGLDPAPLWFARPPVRRLVGNCRDFSVLFAAALRQHGVPARARCGFAAYFRPGGFEDHWVGEYFDAAAARWRLVDPQLDPLQIGKLGITFDPLDLPPGSFVNGGEAWRMCRAGTADPAAFGIFDMHGRWFVRGNLVRDFLALNKIELLPWDPWGLMAGPAEDETTGASDLALLDELASICVHPEAKFDQLPAMLSAEPRLAAYPSWWTSGHEQDR